MPAGSFDGFAQETTPTGGTSGFSSMQGVISAAGGTGGVLIDQTGAGSLYNLGMAVPVNGTFAYRTMYKSITAELVASAVADQGSVFASQHAPVYHKTASTVVGTNGVYDFFHPGAMFTPPLNETDMALMCPDYYEDDARHGVFIPHRLSGPDQPYATRVPMGEIIPSSGLPSAILPLSANGNGPPNRCLYPSTRSSLSPYAASASQVVSTWWTGRDTAEVNPPIASGIDNVNQSMIIFRNLTGAASGVFPSSVRVKCVVGLEIIPEPQGVDRIFARPPAQYDPRALEAYYALSREMRSAYPASYNSLAGVLAVAANIGARLWPYAKMAAPLLLRALESRVDSALSKSAAPRRIESRVDAAMARAKKPPPRKRR
jgi:hypothetical protein